MQICCKTNRSCVMFKCAGPKAATWGRDGGSEHVGGRGDPPENTYQFLLIGSLGFMFFIFFARCVQHIAQYLREETYFHYPHSDILIRWKYTYNLASIHICCETNWSRVMFKCAGPKAATWGQDGGSEHVGCTGDRPENTYQFLLIGSLGFMFFNFLQDVCNILHNTWERKHIFIIHIQIFWSPESIHLIWQVYIYVVKLIVHVSCSNVQDPKPQHGDEMEVLSALVVEETHRRTPTNFCWLGVWVSCFSFFLQDVCKILHNTWERKHIFIIHIQIFWSAESIHIIWQVYIYVVKLIVHVSCSNVQDPKPQHGDKMEVESTELLEETTSRQLLISVGLSFLPCLMWTWHLRHLLT